MKVCSVGKSDRRRDVTQGIPLRPSEWGFKIRYFPNIYGDFCTFSYFSLDTEDQIFQWSNSYRYAVYTYGVDLCNFQQYHIVLQWVKESSRRGDVTTKAAAEWRTGAGSAGEMCKSQVWQPERHGLLGHHRDNLEYHER